MRVEDIHIIKEENAWVLGFATSTGMTDRHSFRETCRRERSLVGSGLPVLLSVWPKPTDALGDVFRAQILNCRRVDT